MTFSRLAILIAVATLTACHPAPANDASSRSANEPISTTSSFHGPMDRAVDALFSAPDGAAAPAPTKAKSSKEQPVAACGTRGSYRYVASEYKCTDGGNPFAGNANAARDSRKGNVGGNAFIIDLYVVPCAGGDEKVYVDMYAGCPEGVSPFLVSWRTLHRRWSLTSITSFTSSSSSSSSSTAFLASPTSR